MTTQVIGVSGTRDVTVDSWGDPRGFPVFLLHGTPGSRRGPVPRASVLYRLGVRLISYDRPGYGGSGRHKGRAVADAARDVRAIADHLKLGEFAVVGRSGGGPHALACAALIEEERLRTVAVLVGLAPSDASDLDWFAGMSDSNISEYQLASHTDSAAVVADLTQRANEIRDDPESLLKALYAEMTESDKEIVRDVALRRLLLASFREALNCGPYGWIDDVLAFRRPWGFKVDKITIPVRLWHGQDDVFSPVWHSHWLAEHIPQAHIDIEPGAAHFSAMTVLPRILAQLRADSTHPRQDAGAPVAVSVGLGVESAKDAALLA